LSTVRNAAVIVVMGEGGIKDMGTHDALMQTSEIYKDLIRRQIFPSAEKPPAEGEEK
jgi:ABC-type multidrug transport system fused ATPase/permease subunit